MTEPEIATELYVLTHEVGHFFSWLSGQDGDNEARSLNAEMRAAVVRSDEIFNALAKATSEEVSKEEFAHLVNTKVQLELTDAERRLIFNEEKRAWALGREMLVEFGLADLQAYDDRAEASLRTYREQLGVLD